jgi:hypothetical protein
VLSSRVTGDPRQRLVTAGVTLSAFCLGALGVLVLFAPEETTRALRAPVAGGPFMPLLASALLGLAALNWIARGSMLGGIYGRSVVVCNQVHFTIGALVLIKHGVAVGTSVACWTIAVLYVLGALFFVRLLVGSSPTPELK